MSHEADAGPHGFRPRPVVLLTASMGAGHDGVAEELAKRLHRRGFPTIQVPFWRILPFRIGVLIIGFYRWMILRAPWLYESIYRLWLRPRWRTDNASPIATLAKRRLGPWVQKTRPAAMVSTFHLCSQVLGDMRRDGVLQAPAISLVVDFAAHATWINSDVDLHLCLHPSQASRATAMGAPRVEVCGPVVLPHFENPRWSKASARATLGLDDDDEVVLVVAGSWGAGDVVQTSRVLAADRAVKVLVAAGDNGRLLRRLQALSPGVRAIGWIDDMDRLIAASDVVVENAGGLTAMEAMAMERPVVTYLPIPGHGRDNARYMEQAGIAVYARCEDELIGAVHRLSREAPERDQLVARGRAMFRVDAATRIEAIVRQHLGDVPGGNGQAATCR